MENQQSWISSYSYLCNKQQDLQRSVNKSCDIRVLFAAQKQKNTGKKVDIVAMATGWGCKVVQLEELLAELRRLKPLPKKESSQVCEGRGRLSVCVRGCYLFA